jgi:hypothetical protein
VEPDTIRHVGLLVRRLASADLPAVEQHLLGLSAQDRRARFLIDDAGEGMAGDPDGAGEDLASLRGARHGEAISAASA